MISTRAECPVAPVDVGEGELSGVGEGELSGVGEGELSGVGEDVLSGVGEGVPSGEAEGVPSGVEPGVGTESRKSREIGLGEDKVRVSRSVNWEKSSPA